MPALRVPISCGRTKSSHMIAVFSLAIPTSPVHILPIVPAYPGTESNLLAAGTSLLFRQRKPRSNPLLRANARNREKHLAIAGQGFILCSPAVAASGKNHRQRGGLCKRKSSMKQQRPSRGQRQHVADQSAHRLQPRCFCRGWGHRLPVSWSAGPGGRSQLRPYRAGHRRHSGPGTHWGGYRA